MSSFHILHTKSLAKYLMTLSLNVVINYRPEVCDTKYVFSSTRHHWSLYVLTPKWPHDSHYLAPSLLSSLPSHQLYSTWNLLFLQLFNWQKCIPFKNIYFIYFMLFKNIIFNLPGSVSSLWEQELYRDSDNRREQLVLEWSR